MPFTQVQWSSLLHLWDLCCAWCASKSSTLISRVFVLLNIDNELISGFVLILILTPSHSYTRILPQFALLFTSSKLCVFRFEFSHMDGAFLHSSLVLLLCDSNLLLSDLLKGIRLAWQCPRLHWGSALHHQHHHSVLHLGIEMSC